MRFYKRLYVDSSVKKKRRQIVWKLKTGKVMPNVYCIALANNQDMLEIYHNAVLKQSLPEVSSIYYRDCRKLPGSSGINTDHADGYNGINRHL